VKNPFPQTGVKTPGDQLSIVLLGAIRMLGNIVMDE